MEKGWCPRTFHRGITAYKIYPSPRSLIIYANQNENEEVQKKYHPLPSDQGSFMRKDGLNHVRQSTALCPSMSARWS